MELRPAANVGSMAAAPRVWLKKKLDLFWIMYLVVRSLVHYPKKICLVVNQIPIGLVLSNDWKVNFSFTLKLFFFSNQAISKIIHKKQLWETITGETSSYYTIDSKMSLWKDHLSHLIWNMNTKWFFKKINLFFFSITQTFLTYDILNFLIFFHVDFLQHLNVFFVMGAWIF